MEIRKSEEGSLRAYMKRKYGNNAFEKNGDIKMSYLKKAKNNTSDMAVKKKLNFAIVSRGWKHGK